jgi:hypothetical protein
MTSTGLLAFEILCRCGNDLDALREGCCPGSDGWVGLTQLVQVVDAMIDGVVHSDGLEDNEEDA